MLLKVKLNKREKRGINCLVIDAAPFLTTLMKE